MRFYRRGKNMLSPLQLVPLVLCRYCHKTEKTSANLRWAKKAMKKEKNYPDYGCNNTAPGCYYLCNVIFNLLMYRFCFSIKQIVQLSSLLSCLI